MAKNEGAEAIMPAAEMKPLLLLAKRQPVGCALALTKDKQGVVLLDKKAQGRKLGALLKAAAASAKVELDTGSVRFGHANAGEEDGGVHFIVNKEPPGGLRAKLLEHLKKAGCGKCEISVDATLDAADDGAADGAPGTGHAAAGAADASRQAPAHEAAQPGAAALGMRLTGLVKRLAGMPHAPGADAMATAARAAQAALKAGDTAAATRSMDTLERLLGGPAPHAASAGGAATGAAAAAGAGAALGTHPAASAFAKSAAIWTATGGRVKAEIAKLQDVIVQHYDGRPSAAGLPAAFRAKVGPMLDRFDHTLSDQLAALAASTDASAHPGLVAKVEHTIADYEAFLAADQVIRQLDANPFAPLSIKATAEKSLAAVRKAVTSPAPAR